MVPIPLPPLPGLQPAPRRILSPPPPPRFSLLSPLSPAGALSRDSQCPFARPPPTFLGPAPPPPTAGSRPGAGTAQLAMGCFLSFPSLTCVKGEGLATGPGYDVMLQASD